MTLGSSDGKTKLQILLGREGVGVGERVGLLAGNVGNWVGLSRGEMPAEAAVQCASGSGNRDGEAY